MDPVAAATVLEKAADLIEVGGLCKEQTQDGEGRYCSVGALDAAERLVGVRRGVAEYTYVAAMVDTGLVPPVRPTEFLWVDYHDDVRSDTWPAVVKWNNAPERTAEDVIDVMRRAAKDLRNTAVAA